MQPIKENMMQWGETMQLFMENRSLFYSPVLKHWRVKKWAGKGGKHFLYDGESFAAAFDVLLGPHAPGTDGDQREGTES